MSSAHLPSSTVDAEHPWLGLASFTEETRAFFHGRDDDIAELARRVQRKSLTVLFGQSGHGKTSILRAGLVPRLRPDGYCPVYVRLDYSPDSPSPADQIKAAIFRETLAAGHWTQTGSSVAGESLWEFLHHRDDVLQDAQGRALTPLLIFDQFEEIFTLAQADDVGRQRASTFLSELADLVENRAPAALELKIDRDEVDASKFDFARADYRILLSLREDYLAHLEALKDIMPSVTQNRLRLARFNGTQALAAVRQPAPHLVDEAVAAQVVRFVSGGTDIARAEVEPSLLSLVCRELNNTRLARGQATITADLLAGSRDTILQEFYERALADQPAGVRRFIEDELLTDSGFRESVAEERVKKAFVAANAAPAALAELVGRRLLRVEERLDVRRVELTHDVLSGVVSASRSVRREREAKEIAEQQLAATRAKEAAAQQALWRARMIATVCAVLALGAIGSAVFGYFNYRRARTAEIEAKRSATEAQEAAVRTHATEELAQEARSEAEKIVSYLLDDFYNELEPIGRLNVVGELARRAVDYYRALPVTLRSDTTVRNHALALARYGSVLTLQGKTDDGAPLLEEAVRLFRRLQDNGDKSQELSLGLSFALRSQSRLYFGQGRRNEALAAAHAAVDVLRPTVRAGGASVAVSMEYGEALNRLGFQQLRSGQEEICLGTFGECRDTFASIGARDASNLRAASAYADTAAWVMEAASFTGRSEEAEVVGKEALALAITIIAQNPGDRRALRARALSQRYLADVYAEKMQIEAALKVAQASESDYTQLLQLDPTNAISRNNLAVSQTTVIGLMASRGDIAEALVRSNRLIANAPIDQMPINSLSGVVFSSANQTAFLAQVGDRAAIEKSRAFTRRAFARATREVGSENPQIQTLGLIVTRSEAAADSMLGQNAKAVTALTEAIARIDATIPKTDGERQDKIFSLRSARVTLAIAELRQSHWREAEKAARAAAPEPTEPPVKALSDRQLVGTQQAILAIAVARQGRMEEAATIIAPALAFQRELAARGYESFQQLDLAVACYAAALANPSKADTLLAESSAILEKLPPQIRALHDAVELAQLIGEVQGATKR